MDALSPELLAFIERYIDSVEALEILLLLKRSPQTYWAAPAIAEQLGMRPESVSKKLEDLAREGLLRVADGTIAWRYLPANDEADRNVTALAAAYADKRVSVINAVFSRNLERLRAFSNAFRVKS